MEGTPRSPLSGWLDLLRCPSCKASLLAEGTEALGCAACAATYPISEGVVALRAEAVSDPRTETVRRFYEVAPFPGYPPRDSLTSLRARAERSEFARLLDQAISGSARIVEVGCGTGQLSLYLARADRRVVACDLTRASLLLGARAKERFGVEGVLFVETDLHSPGVAEGRFDVVISSGVLHHTPDPRASFARLSRLCRPGGIIVLGLYNAYARLPHRLRRGLAIASGFRFFPLDPVLRERRGEPARREAWLRDQYMHPEEHRHTLAEVQRWFAENGVDYLRTYPDVLFGAERLRGGDLFTAAGDNWAIENVLSQISWMWSLAYEGGLFVTIGRRRDSPLDRGGGVAHIARP